MRSGAQRCATPGSNSIEERGNGDRSIFPIPPLRSQETRITKPVAEDFQSYLESIVTRGLSGLFHIDQQIRILLQTIPHMRIGG